MCVLHIIPIRINDIFERIATYFTELQTDVCPDTIHSVPENQSAFFKAII
jgi:hypothetical protein